MKLILKMGTILVFIFYTGFLMFSESNQAKQPLNNNVADKKEQQHLDVKEVQVSRSDGNIVSIALEDYLVGVVASEMPATFELEALKAQAIAARTFVVARAFMVDDTTSSQVYKNDEELKAVWKEEYDERIEKIRTAVKQTQGQIITYEGNPITASFFSSSNGATNNAENYWKNQTPYLVSVDSHWDETSNPNFSVSISKSKQEVMNALGVSSLSIGKITRYENGYVQEIEVGGILFSGREVREKLGLRSSDFDFEIADEVSITTRGSGHGIGMSQYGAQGMALEGYTCEEILTHYYQNTKIESFVYK